MSDTLLARALDWIDRHLEAFDPLWKNGQFDFDRGQRLGELAILVRTVAAMSGQSNDPRIGRMAELLRRTQLAPVYRDRLLRAPLEFMLFLETYGALRSLGVEDEGMRAQLQKALRAGWVNQTERFPHRAMDIRSCLDACDLACDGPELDELYRRSILGAAPDPILLSEHDLYALTHVVMFLCDFGSRAPSIPRSEREAVSFLLRALVIVAARDRHWDLLAEFLLCWSCLDLPEDSLIQKAWAALSRAQRVDGAVPGPETESALPPFEHVYHTTLVCALAASIRDGRRSRPVDAPPAARADDDTQSTELEEVASEAASWLTRLARAELQRPVSSPLRLSQILIGLWSCSALGKHELPLGTLARITTALAAAASSNDWHAMPPLLKCVSAGWVARFGLVVPAMHGVNGFLRRAGAVFEAASEAGGQHALELGEVWTALHCLGMAPDPPIVSEDDLASHAASLELDGDPGALEELVVRIEAWAAYGTRRVAFGGEAWLGDLIAGLAIDACRRYDLSKASQLIRVGVWLRGADAGASRLLRFSARYLMLNRHEDGAFGLLAAELADRAPDDRIDCLLPLTVNCMLALAAFFRGWHVVAELATLAPAVREATTARVEPACLQA